jgi:hypothetical protein
MATIERRRYVRLVVQLPVDYRDECGWRRGRMLDLSLGGLLLQTEEPLTVGPEIELSFVLELDGKQVPVRCRGRIQRQQFHGGGRAGELFPAAGVELIEVRQGLEAMRRFLALRLGLPLEGIGAPACGAETHGVLA